MTHILLSCGGGLGLHDGWLRLGGFRDPDEKKEKQPSDAPVWEKFEELRLCEKDDVGSDS